MFVAPFKQIKKRPQLIFESWAHWPRLSLFGCWYYTTTYSNATVCRLRFFSPIITGIRIGVPSRHDTRLLHLWHFISIATPSIGGILPCTFSNKRDECQPSGTQAGQRISVQYSIVTSRIIFRNRYIGVNILNLTSCEILDAPSETLHGDRLCAAYVISTL